MFYNMNSIVPRGKYNSKILKAEPMISWMTTTEIGILIWTYNKIDVIPRYKSSDNKNCSIKEEILPKITVLANSPTVIKFGSLVSNFKDFLKGPPQTKTKLYLKTSSTNIFELNYDIPKYWSGPIDVNVPNFTFNFGSCAKLLGDYETFENLFPFDLFKLLKVSSEKSDLNLMLGDNIYLSSYQFDNNSGLIQRYEKLRKMNELKGAWSSVAWSAIPDDHDLGVNDVSFGGPSLYLCRDVFTQMWPNNNENIISPLIWSMFKYDLAFIGLDCRSFSTNPNTTTSTLLGEQQLKWLRQTFYSIKKLYDNPFIFICTGVPFIRPRNTYFSTYPNDQNDIINMILEFNLKNVVFITGSPHFSEVNQRNIGNNITITEFINSPIGTIPRDSDKGFPPNPYTVPGTLLFSTNNFGRIFISGKYEERTLNYRIILPDGSLKQMFKLSQKI
jgi:hypothetical protein